MLFVLMINFSAYAAWSYSIPNHYPSIPKLFPTAAAVAMAEPAVQPAAPDPVQPQPSSEYILGYHTGESFNKPAGEIKSVSIPILMYHKINPYYDRSLYRIWPEEFEWQMQYLKDNGYHSVSISAVMDYFEKGQPLPDKPVVITMDDGYRDNFLYALPILEKFGFTATVFITTNTIAPEGVNNNMLTWSMVKEMSKRGITIGCHTLDHPQLTRVNYNEAWRQIADAKNAIEENLGSKVDVFAYPYGSHDSCVENIVKESGFRAAVTVNPKPVTSAENPFALNRMGIYSNLSRDGFINKLASAEG